MPSILFFGGEVLQHFGGGYEAKGAGEVGDGAVAAGTVEAVTGLFAGISVADFWVHSVLWRENAIDFEFSIRLLGKTEIAAKHLTRALEELIVVSFGKIRNLDTSGIDTSACSPYGDDGYSSIAARGEKAAFVFYAVDSIDDVVVVYIENLIDRFLSKEAVDDANFGLRIDLTAALGHDFDFRLSDFSVLGVDLAVYVALANVV